MDVRARPDRGGLGLGFGFSPSWGLATTPDELLADTAAQLMLSPLETSVNGLRGKADLSYGFAVEDGLLTPYGSWEIDGGGTLGIRLRAAGRHRWLLGWSGAGVDEFKLEYRIGE